MPGVEYKERRSVPRYKSRVPCSVLCASTDSAILTHTEALSVKAISLTIASSPTYGADPSKVGDERGTKIGSSRRICAIVWLAIAP